jgi:nucleoside phosphorylase
MTANPCFAECEYLKKSYELIARAEVKRDALENITVWMGASRHDKASKNLKGLFGCVLEKLGVKVLDKDFEAIIDERVGYDAILIFTCTPGTSARAIELAVNSQCKNTAHKDRLYVFMPQEYQKGYISRKLADSKIAKLHYKDLRLFSNLDLSIFSQFVKDLISISNNKRREISMKFDPTILVVTALELEFTMMKDLLDKIRHDTTLGSEKIQYPHGRILNRDVVLALSGVGNNFSSAIATKAIQKYRSIEYVFVTGIAGGVPYLEDPQEHVRLGDIVVCNGMGIIQYDLGKATETESGQHFSPRNPPRPPDATLLRNAGIHVTDKGCRAFDYWSYLDRLAADRNISRPAIADLCDTPWISDSAVEQPALPEGYDPSRPRIHFGAIGSGNEVVKSASLRDDLKNKHNVKAIEMEASGVADATWLCDKNYFVVRGICDYCNPTKNNVWQPYAAAAAAAFTRELIELL